MSATIITIEELDYRHTGGANSFVLMASSHGHTAIAGPRILRAAPHPDIQWSHPDRDSAEKDAVKLSAYLDALPVKKSKKKSQDKSAYD